MISTRVAAVREPWSLKGEAGPVSLELLREAGVPIDEPRSTGRIVDRFEITNSRFCPVRRITVGAS
jgi:hypothetical protein